MDVANLIGSGRRLVIDFDATVLDCVDLANALKAGGFDSQAFFAAAATVKDGGLVGIPATNELLSSPSWQELLNFLVTWGPIIYAILAKKFGWPPLPV